MTFEEREIEDSIRKRAQYAQQLQQTITNGQEMERWVAEGHLKFIEDRVFKAMEQKAFHTIKAPEFDPANVSHVAQLKALCQSLDLIRDEINGQVSAVVDARAKFNDLENSTPVKEGE